MVLCLGNEYYFEVLSPLRYHNYSTLVQDIKNFVPWNEKPCRLRREIRVHFWGKCDRIWQTEQKRGHTRILLLIGRPISSNKLP